MTDDLRQRMKRIDPMSPGVPTEPLTTESSRQLLETIMSISTKERTEPTGSHRRSWVPALAAVSALVLAIAGGLLFTRDQGSAPLASPLVLTAGGDDTLASCIAFSPQELAKVAEIAFEGTVISANGPEVTLTVNTWFLGGDATEVLLTAPQGLEALIGGIRFTVGAQYLISAQNGTVNYCGFSGPSTPDYRASFEQAFPAS